MYWKIGARKYWFLSTKFKFNINLQKIIMIKTVNGVTADYGFMLMNRVWNSGEIYMKIARCIPKKLLWYIAIIVVFFQLY